MNETIPVVLFAYARPSHLARVLDCLRENRVPLIHAFADGAKGLQDADAVAAVRRQLRAVDWCEVRLVEREMNLGLGRNVIAGVSEVAARHEAFIVWEDDLVCVPGTYAWVGAALAHYADEERVMSVSAWTHPRVTPAGVGAAPYFDGRAECWVWGAWSRSWRELADETAVQKMNAAARRGIASDTFGADLPKMAVLEEAKNIWAVRWLYHHLQHGGLCLRPPWSMVEHIGWGDTATQAGAAGEWSNPPLREAPPVPAAWPEPREHPECRDRWAAAIPRRGLWKRLWQRARQDGRVMTKRLRSVARALVPPPVRVAARAAFGWRWFKGHYESWRAARAACGGYDEGAILECVRSATAAVRDGRAAFERDGVRFAEPAGEPGLLAALRTVADAAERPWAVLDFGGSLGTTWWRHRTEIERLGIGRWDVVEQLRFVAAGRAEFERPPLRFFETVAAAEAEARHELLLASGTLQYLEEPRAVIAGWLAHEPPWVLLNNVPLHVGAPDRLAVQRVPPEICPASYPVWFFNRESLLAAFAGRYDIAAEFASEAVWPVGWTTYASTGLLLRRRTIS